MTDCYKAWWIDDKDSNSKAADELGRQRSDFDVEFQTPNDLDKFETTPDLVLIDWFLNKGELSNYDRGISVEAKIREDHPNVPIYGFTGEIAERNDEQFSQHRFDHGIFKRGDLSESDAADLLVLDLEDYEAIQDAASNEFNALLELLAVPEDDYKGLESIIPREYSNGFPAHEAKKLGARLNFARWVRTRFLTTPGPLLNKTWAATQLGLKSEAIKDYKGRFDLVDVSEDLTYSGVFSHRVEDRFWESQLMRGLAKLERNEEIEVSSRETWRIGVAVLDVPEEDQVRCAICDERFPQTVAAREADEPAKFPAHYRHSNIHHSREGAFKDYRELSRPEE